MEAPRTPRSEQGDGIGELDFAKETFGKNNGAINDTPERPVIPRKIRIGNKGADTGAAPLNFDQYLATVDRSNKKGGKTRKRKTRKTRSRKHKKSHKKSHKKKSHKKTKRKSKKSRK